MFSRSFHLSNCVLRSLLTGASIPGDTRVVEFYGRVGDNTNSTLPVVDARVAAGLPGPEVLTVLNDIRQLVRYNPVTASAWFYNILGHEPQVGEFITMDQLRAEVNHQCEVSGAQIAKFDNGNFKIGEADFMLYELDCVICVSYPHDSEVDVTSREYSTSETMTLVFNVNKKVDPDELYAYLTKNFFDIFEKSTDSYRDALKDAKEFSEKGKGEFSLTQDSDPQWWTMTYTFTTTKNPLVKAVKAVKAA